jgi:hypothetical protein
VLPVFLATTSPAGAQGEDGPTGAASDDREVLLPIEADDTAVPEPSGDIEEMVVLATGRDDFLKDLSISATSLPSTHPTSRSTPAAPHRTRRSSSGASA